MVEQFPAQGPEDPFLTTSATLTTDIAMTEVEEPLVDVANAATSGNGVPDFVKKLYR